jgi:integrase
VSSQWRKISEHLEMRKGKRKTSYRVNFRQGEISLRQVIDERFCDKLKDAKGEASRLIHEAKYGKPRERQVLVRNSELVEQLLKEATTQDPATLAIKENILGKHLLPWLDEHYPMAANLNAETWPKYKLFKRSINPTIALENHSKYFRMLSNRAFELGLVSQKIRVRFSVKKEDFRESGQVISPDEEGKILEACNRVWRNRSLIQRDTGMRPGEVRRLRKDRVNWNADGTVTIRLLEEDTKTHRYREFVLSSPRAVSALMEQRDFYPDSPFFFAMETDHTRHMDKHLNGWKAALKRAGVKKNFTPHDWRHTYATEMFKRVGLSGAAVVCYQIDMSWETARTVYFHVTAEDTRDLAQYVKDARVA